MLVISASWDQVQFQTSPSCSGARMTKGLHICRHLQKAGWRVVLVDYDRWWMQGSRLSGCCAAFHTVPDPEQDPIGRWKYSRTTLSLCAATAEKTCYAMGPHC